MLTFFYDAVKNPVATVKAYSKELGLRPVVLFPGYFPDEVVYAHGFFPVRFWRNPEGSVHTETQLQAFACSPAHSIIEGFLNEPPFDCEAFAFSTICDTLQNTCEIFKLRQPSIKHLCFVLPVTSDKLARRHFIEKELNTLKNALESISKKAVNEEKRLEACNLFNRKRQLIRKLYEIRRKTPAILSCRDFYTIIEASDITPPGIFAERLSDFLEALNTKTAEKGGSHAKKILISGVLPFPSGVLDIIDGCGLRVADDDMLFGRRRFFRPDLENLDASAYDKRLFDGASCPFLFSEKLKRVSDFDNLLVESGADGVVIWHTKFCEPEAFERVALKSAAEKRQMPTLIIETGVDMQNLAGIETRVEGFAELLRG